MPRQASTGRPPHPPCCVCLLTCHLHRLSSPGGQLHHGRALPVHVVTRAHYLISDPECSAFYVSSDGEVPVEETSDASPFAELMQRARDAMESGSQEDQVCLGMHLLRTVKLAAYFTYILVLSIVG